MFMQRTSSGRGLALAGLLAIFCAGAAHAALYKWVGPDGKTTYSDVPPPKSIQQLEKSTLKPAESSASALPYVLAEASKNHPVTLFTGAQCAPCAEARDFLKHRGIPFIEKTVVSNDDIAVLRQVSGDAQLPVLLIGRNKQLGFEPGAWNLALTAASYPPQSNLPADYRFAPAQPAAPKSEPAAQGVPATPRSAPATAPAAAPQRLPATGNAPPGFRF